MLAVCFHFPISNLYRHHVFNLLNSPLLMMLFCDCAHKVVKKRNIYLCQNIHLIFQERDHHIDFPKLFAFAWNEKVEHSFSEAAKLLHAKT